MKLTAKLAYSQIKINRRRTGWTLIGIAISVSMITAICGFAAGAIKTYANIAGGPTDFEAKKAMIALALILGGIVAVSSVIVVSNAFRVSANERTRQFGILKSVGATKKQIAATVMYEGLFLSAIGIPAGVCFGVLLQFIATKVANVMFSPANYYMAVEIVFYFVVSVPAIVAAAAGSFATVMISAWLPARKAAKIAAIDAVKGTGTITVKSKNAKASKFAALFGFEGVLAAKSINRNGKNFRATVISLSISVVLFMATASFMQNAMQFKGLHFDGLDAQVFAWFSTSRIITYDENGEFDDVTETLIDNETAELVALKLREFPGAEIFGAGLNVTYQWYDEKENRPRSVGLLSVDREHYAGLCEAAGVPYGSNILVNSGDLLGQTLTMLYIHNADSVKEIHIDGALKEVPAEIKHHASMEITIITPDTDAEMYNWFAKTGDPAGFAVYAKDTLNAVLPSEMKEHATLEAVDIAGQTAALRAIADLIQTAVYGFVAMLTLIALTNVISVISSNVAQRRREFAILASVGMTRAGIRRMLSLEAVLCGLRSLLFGLPLGSAAAVFVHRAILMSVWDFPFIFPWFALIECVFGVFAVTWVTMRFSASRLKNDSIVGAIRTDGEV
jgi:putative ABC transport system permease protein